MSRIGVCVAGIAISLLAGTALGQAGSPFAQAPTGQQFLRYYPQRAMNLGIEGVAIINCAVSSEDTLVDCQTKLEAPSGLEFGPAAIKLSVLFKMQRRSGSASSSDGRVDVPINFRLAAPGRPPLALIRRASIQGVEKLRPAGLSDSGTATLRCHIKADSKPPQSELERLTDCKTINEAPTNVGLADAAQSIALLYQFDPNSLGTVKANTTVDVTAAWLAKPAIPQPQSP